MTLALHYRVIEKRNFHGSMEMSFFISCPIRTALPGPDPVPVSGRGTLRPPGKGHEIKKDISMLILQFLSCIILKLSARVIC
jgi:hypothetical protein